jgi:hypothetical protein
MNVDIYFSHKDKWICYWRSLKHPKIWRHHHKGKEWIIISVVFPYIHKLNFSWLLLHYLKKIFSLMTNLNLRHILRCWFSLFYLLLKAFFWFFGKTIQDYTKFAKIIKNGFRCRVAKPQKLSCFVDWPFLF